MWALVTAATALVVPPNSHLTPDVARVTSACTHVGHLTPARTTSVVAMAGFGAKQPAKGKKAKAPKKAKLSPKAQWDKYRAMLKEDAPTVPVSARVKGALGVKWHDVGFVSVRKEADAQAATQFHKRLILEHALRLHPQLVADKEFLECGHGDPPVSLEKTEAECECGFMGVPDPASGYYTAGSEGGKVESAAGSGVVDSKGMTKIG